MELANRENIFCEWNCEWNCEWKCEYFANGPWASQLARDRPAVRLAARPVACPPARLPAFPRARPACLPARSRKQWHRITRNEQGAAARTRDRAEDAGADRTPSKNTQIVNKEAKEGGASKRNSSKGLLASDRPRALSASTEEPATRGGSLHERAIGLKMSKQTRLL